MKLFDSHCHLDDRAYDNDIDDVVHRMHTAGVVSAMTVGATLQRSIKAVSLAESFSGLYASVGIHPHDAKNCCEETLEDLRNLVKRFRVHAWGEIGLDFNRMFSSRQDQEKWLVRQLEVSDEMDLPVIFHERDSNGRLIEILKTHFNKGRNGVIHCFSGDRNALEQYLDMGLYIGITGIVTIKGRGADLRKLVPFIPVDRILVETDAPYLTPMPEKSRAQRNEPAFVRSVLLKLAEIKKEDPAHLADKIWNNTRRLYNVRV
jgi:TatD DNase family protein